MEEEPVYYCKRCLSLKIKYLSELAPGGADSDDALYNYYCDDCMAAGDNIGCCSIEEWEKMYKEKYDIKYLDNEREGKRVGRGIWKA